MCAIFLSALIGCKMACDTRAKFHDIVYTPFSPFSLNFCLYFFPICPPFFHPISQIFHIATATGLESKRIKMFKKKRSNGNLWFNETIFLFSLILLLFLYSFLLHAEESPLSCPEDDRLECLSPHKTEDCLHSRIREMSFLRYVQYFQGDLNKPPLNIFSQSRCFIRKNEISNYSHGDSKIMKY